MRRDFEPTPWYSENDRAAYLDAVSEWREFYARVESVVPGDGEARRYEWWEVQLDCVEVGSFERIPRSAESGFAVAGELITVMMRLELDLPRGQWPPTTWPELWYPAAETPWWHVSVSDSRPGLPLVQHDNTNDSTGVVRYLEGWRPADPVVSARLDKLISLDDAQDVSEDDVEQLLHITAGGPLLVGVFHVGQGSANAICDDTARPLVYVDLGGGVYQNAKTYPYNPSANPFCDQHSQPVLLSHWDADHWVTGDRFPQYQSLPWIVPRQVIGPSHLKFAAKLQAQRSLRVFNPSRGWTATTGAGKLQRCSGSSRNDSGFALLGPDPSDSPVLLPGDCGYQHIPDTGDQQLGGLVGTHHGSVLTAAARSNIPRPDGSNRSITYSWGRGNSYGHPRTPTVQAHEARGWAAHNRLDTATPKPGHINYTSLAGIGSLPDPDSQGNCGASQCDCAASKSG